MALLVLPDTWSPLEVGGVRAGLYSAHHAACRMRASALGEGEAGEHTEGNARGAQPHARLRWQESWGTAERARCPAKVPNGY